MDRDSFARKELDLTRRWQVIVGGAGWNEKGGDEQDVSLIVATFDTQEEAADLAATLDVLFQGDVDIAVSDLEED